MTKPSYEELGNFWTERELAVIHDLAGKQELSPAAVLRQGLRLYQLQFQPPRVGRKATPPLCPSQELSFVGDPMNAEYACFGGLYYTLNHQECVEKLLKAYTARVRGLLQRQWISVEERLPELDGVMSMDGVSYKYSRNVLVWSWFGYDSYGAFIGHLRENGKWYVDGLVGTVETQVESDKCSAGVTHWQPIVPPNFRNAPELLWQGAESADIGKLDTADEKVNECNRHDDCAAAEAAVLARHPGKTISLTFHCYDDECEDCFG